MSEFACGDSACMFSPPKSGMVTNGGCRCLKNLKMHQFKRLVAECDQLRAQLARMRGLIEALYAHGLIPVPTFRQEAASILNDTTALANLDAKEQP